MSSRRLRNSGRNFCRTSPMTRSRTRSVSSPSFWLTRILGADVRRQDDDRVAEVDRAALAVGQASVIEHLQQHVEHVGVRLLDLVEQDHLVGAAAHRLGERAALLVADVARRRADEPRDRVLLHVLAHVDANQRALVVEQERGQRLRQLGLADARRAEEHERADRPVRDPAGRRARAARRSRRHPPPRAGRRRAWPAHPPFSAASRARPRACGRPGCRSSARRRRRSDRASPPPRPWCPWLPAPRSSLSFFSSSGILP